MRIAPASCGKNDNRETRLTTTVHQHKHKQQKSEPRPLLWCPESGQHVRKLIKRQNQGTKSNILSAFVSFNNFPTPPPHGTGCAKNRPSIPAASGGQDALGTSVALLTRIHIQQSGDAAIIAAAIVQKTQCPGKSPQLSARHSVETLHSHQHIAPSTVAHLFVRK